MQRPCLPAPFPQHIQRVELTLTLIEKQPPSLSSWPASVDATEAFTSGESSTVYVRQLLRGALRVLGTRDATHVVLCEK